MADQPFPREQSIPFVYLTDGLPALVVGVMNTDERNDAQQLINMYQKLDDAHKERVAAQVRGGRVLRQAVMQIFNGWQMQQSRRQPPPILGVRASLADTTKPDLT